MTGARDLGRSERLLVEVQAANRRARRTDYYSAPAGLIGPLYPPEAACMACLDEQRELIKAHFNSGSR